MPKQLMSCVSSLKGKRGESSAYAICSSKTGWVRKKGGGWKNKKTGKTFNEKSEFDSFIFSILEGIQIDKWEEIKSSNKMIAAAAKLCENIEELDNSYEALIVGGSVRDLLMGNTNVHDVDIATNAPLSVIESIYPSHDIGKSKDFGIVTVLFGGFVFEVANFRTEEGYSDNRRPDKVEIADTFELDSKRRDFTINSMGLNYKGEIVDYHNGAEDIKNKVIRAVGDAKNRFTEDALRLLRAIRFAAKFGFDIEPETEKAIKELAFTVNNLSPERIREELFKTAELGGTALATYIRKLDHVGLLEKVLPEIKELQKFKHNRKHHPEGDVYDHVLAAVAASPSKDPIDNLAVLFHDLGKAVTLGHKEDGTPTYYGHEEAGVPIFKKIADRLKFSNKDQEAIELSISQHMTGHYINKLSDKKILKLRHNPHWNTLKNTVYSDEASRLHLFNPEEFKKKMEHVEAVFKKFGDTHEFEKKMSGIINGKMILDTVPGIKGEKIGKIKNEIRDYIIGKQFNVSPSEIVEMIKSLAKDK